MLNSASITRGFNKKQISPSYKTLNIPSSELHVAQWIRICAYWKNMCKLNLL